MCGGVSPLTHLMGMVCDKRMDNRFSSLALMSSAKGNSNFTTLCASDRFALFVFTMGSFNISAISLDDKMSCIMFIFIVYKKSAAHVSKNRKEPARYDDNRRILLYAQQLE
jgi:hypothetical protein